MLDVESPPSARAARPCLQEKRLRKRRELDALVRDVGGGRRRKGGGGSAAQELLSREEGSSSEGSAGEGRGQERLGVTVWRGVHGHQYCTLWWGLKWGLGASTVFLLASITIWLHVSTRFELDVVRQHIVRGESRRGVQGCHRSSSIYGHLRAPPQTTLNRKSGQQSS